MVIRCSQTKIYAIRKVFSASINLLFCQEDIKQHEKRSDIKFVKSAVENIQARVITKPVLIAMIKLTVLTLLREKSPNLFQLLL